MKKLLMVMALAGMTATGFAQEAPVQKHSVATNSFWSNWFIQAGANWNAWYSDQEHGAGNSNSPIEDFRSHVGASVAVGKWFTPGIGLRTKINGIWGKTVLDNETSKSNKYWTANEQVLFNLSNLICGYNEKRIWNLIPFAGGGITRNMSYNTYAMQLGVGVLNTFRVSPKLAVNLELGWDCLEGDADGIDKTNGNRGWDSHDNRLYAEIGLTYNLGKATWSRTPDVDAINAQHQAEVDALNAQVNELRNRKPEVVEKIVEKRVEVPAAHHDVCVSDLVFVAFAQGKANLTKEDMKALDAIKKGAHVQIVGTASPEGSKAINDRLSQARADVVAKYLKGRGVIVDEATGKGVQGVTSNRLAIVYVK